MPSGRYPVSDFMDCGGRLTLTSGVPVTTSDVTGASTVYFTPASMLGGYGRIGLWSGSRWIGREFSEISIAVPSTKFRPFDVYAYWTGSAVALETVDWNQFSLAMSNQSNATPVAVVTGSNHGRSVGDLVAIDGVATATSLNNSVWRVGIVGGATTFTLDDSVAGGSGTGGTFYVMNSSRFTSIAFQNGVAVKNGDATRRLIGTCMTWNTSGQTEDSVSKRFVSNLYNTAMRDMRAVDTTSSWTYNGSTYREARGQNSKLNRCQFVSCLGTFYTASVSVQTNDNNQGSCGIGVNRTSLAEDQVSAVMATAIDGLISAEKSGWVAAGYNFLSWVEATYGGVRTFSGTEGLSTGTGKSSGIIASIAG